MKASLLRGMLTIVPLALASNDLLAGTKGYTAVIVDIGPESFFESSVYSTSIRGDFKPSAELQDCWIHRATGNPGISLLLRKKIPEGISADLAKGVWNRDKLAIEQMQTLLKEAKSPDGNGAVDGVYIVKAEKGEIAVMALGTRAPIGTSNPTRQIAIVWNEKNPSAGAAHFDLALCRVSAPLDYGFGP